MSNSTLALQKRDYESEVGSFLGWGRGTHGGDEEWTADKVIKIQFDVRSGLRRFYYCSHPWSFMKPFREVTLPEGTTKVTLPEDFGGIDSGTKASLTNTDQTFLQELWFTGPGRVVQALAESASSTGLPRMIAVRPIKGLAPGQLQRSELIFFPEADQEYTLTFPAFFYGDCLLDVTYPFAYGGPDHHETILESCLAVAEMRRDNMIGVHANEFQRLLALSIQIDRRKNPSSMGPNFDTSDGLLWNDRWNGHGWKNDGGGVTINGIRYS